MCRVLAIANGPALKQPTFGLVGFVRNRYDGSVEAVFEGDDTSVRTMAERCGKGPLFARVSQVQRSEVQATGLQDFSIEASVA